MKKFLSRYGLPILVIFVGSLYLREYLELGYVTVKPSYDQPHGVEDGSAQLVAFGVPALGIIWLTGSFIISRKAEKQSKLEKTETNKE